MEIEENEPEASEERSSLFKIIAYIGIAGNAIVGVVAFFFMVSGLTGTGFLTDIDDSSISTTKVILSVVILLVIVVLCFAVVLGLLKMLKFDKMGIRLFLAANLVWILLTFLILRDLSFYQLGIFSGIFTLVVVFLSREDSKEI